MAFRALGLCVNKKTFFAIESTVLHSLFALDFPVVHFVWKKSCGTGLRLG